MRRIARCLIAGTLVLLSTAEASGDPGPVGILFVGTPPGSSTDRERLQIARILAACAAEQAGVTATALASYPTAAQLEGAKALVLVTEGSGEDATSSPAEKEALAVARKKGLGVVELLAPRLAPAAPAGAPPGIARVTHVTPLAKDHAVLHGVTAFDLPGELAAAVPQGAEERALLGASEAPGAGTTPASLCAVSGETPTSRIARFAGPARLVSLDNEHLRRVLVNLALWAAGVEPPPGGAAGTIDRRWLKAPAHGTPACRPEGAILPLRRGRTGQRGWQKLLEGEAALGTWIRKGEATWELQGGALIGSGGKGYLFSPRSDYSNFELRARVLLERGGNSGLFFRVAVPAENKVKGYEAQINHSHRDPVRTGSIFKLANVSEKLIADEGWFDLGIVADGERLQVYVNGALTADLKNQELSRGHFGIQQHVEGNRVEIRDLEVLELD